MGLQKILWLGHKCNSVPATCWVKFQLVWICMSWSRDKMWRQAPLPPPPPPPPSWQTLCCVEKSMVRPKFISAACCIKFSWFEFVCHEAGTWCREKPSDLAWFYEKILVLGGKIFTPQHVAAWNSAGLNLCIMRRVHGDHIIGTVPATSPLTSVSWLLSHYCKVCWVALKCKFNLVSPNNLISPYYLSQNQRRTKN